MFLNNLLHFLNASFCICANKTTKTDIHALWKKIISLQWETVALKDFNMRTKCHVIANFFFFFFFFFAEAPLQPQNQSFTAPLIKSCPALWPYCPTSHAFSGGIWSEIRQESTETSLTLLLPYAAHSGRWTECGTRFGWSTVLTIKSTEWNKVLCLVISS